MLRPPSTRMKNLVCCCAYRLLTQHEHLNISSSRVLVIIRAPKAVDRATPCFPHPECDALTPRPDVPPPRLRQDCTIFSDRRRQTQPRTEPIHPRRSSQSSPRAASSVLFSRSPCICLNSKPSQPGTSQCPSVLDRPARTRTIHAPRWFTPPDVRYPPY